MFWQAVRDTHQLVDGHGYLCKASLELLFSASGFSVLYSRCVAYSPAILLFLGTRSCSRVRQKRYEIVLLAVLPVIGAFIAGCIENRLLLAIPFWMILMGFTFDRPLKTGASAAFKIPVWGVSAVMVIAGLAPSIQYVYSKTKNPFGIRYYAQQEVAVSRFLREVVAGTEPANPPRLEHDEFNRIEGIPDAPYETFVCQETAYSIIHLFLHDYDDKKILSFCGRRRLRFWARQQIWSANKKTLVELCSERQRSEANLGKASQNRQNNQNVRAVPQPGNGGVYFVFVWRKRKRSSTS